MALNPSNSSNLEQLALKGLKEATSFIHSLIHLETNITSMWPDIEGDVQKYFSQGRWSEANKLVNFSTVCFMGVANLTLV